MAKTSCKGVSETLRIFAVAGCLAAMTARAETYYLSQNANTISPFTSANIGSYWTNSVGVAPVYGQVSASEDALTAPSRSRSAPCPRRTPI